MPDGRPKLQAGLRTNGIEVAPIRMGTPAHCSTALFELIYQPLENHMAKAKTKSQLHSEIYDLQSRLSHAHTCLETERATADGATRMAADCRKQRDDAIARATSLDQYGSRLFKQLTELRSENQLNLDAMTKAAGIINEGAERITTLKAELTAMERALAITSGVRATG